MMITCLCVCSLVRKEKGDGRSVCALLLLLVMSVCVYVVRCDTMRCGVLWAGLVPVYVSNSFLSS